MITHTLLRLRESVVDDSVVVDVPSHRRWRTVQGLLNRRRRRDDVQFAGAPEYGDQSSRAPVLDRRAMRFVDPPAFAGIHGGVDESRPGFWRGGHKLVEVLATPFSVGDIVEFSD